MSRRAILRTALLALAFVALDFVPRYGRPAFRYTGSDLAVPVWNVGWPVPLWIYDARNGWHDWPLTYVVPPAQVFLVLVWSAGERVAARLPRRARIRAAVLAAAFLAMNLVPHRGTPSFLDPPASVWMIGWPLAVWFDDPNQGWSAGPGALLAPPIQMFLVVAWMLGESVVPRLSRRARIRTAVLAAAFLAMDLVPNYGTLAHPFPRVPVWMLGWPFALWIDDPDVGWSATSNIVLAPSFQALILAFWMSGEADQAPGTSPADPRRWD